MFKNYLTTTLRSLRKDKMSSLITISGLAVGMAVAMLIGLWIYGELSFNKYHQHYDSIAQVMRHQDQQDTRITSGYHPLPLAGALRSSYGNYFRHVVVSRQTEEHILSAGVSKQFVQQGRFMQWEAPDMLTLKMLSGQRHGLKEPGTILLSASLAKKLFGDTDPTGKILTIDNSTPAKVTGVYEDLPDNSEFRYVSFIAPLDEKELNSGWDDYFILIYVEMAAGTDFDKVTGIIKDLYLSHVDKQTAATKPELLLHPMSKWHLYSRFENGKPATSDQMRFVWFFGFIGLFVLLLACINFTNLSTARSEKRAREVGIRKAIGSLRSQLLIQFLFESLVVAALAFVLSIILVIFILPWFSRVAGKDISILWANPLFWLAGIVFMFITALLAGSYPAFYLSSFNPVSVLKGSFRAGRYSALPRKILLVLQFTVSIMLSVSTIVVYRQIKFTKDRPVGYSRESLIMVHMLSPDWNYNVLKNELLDTRVVSGTASAGGPVTDVWSMNKGFDWNGKDPAVDPAFNTLSVSQDYGNTIGWQFIAGNGFSSDLATDSAGLVINEAAAKVMGFKEPVGEFVRWEPGWRKGGSFKILGVIRNMVMESPFEPATPTIFLLDSSKNWVFIRINPRVSAHQTIAKIETVFRQLIPSAPFEYKFADEEYNKKFAAEERVGTLATVFAMLAIFISCLGLFGLASFIAERRTKEISVRKVLGASVFSVWRLMSKEFVMLVIISLLIATPTDYIVMYNWLQNYPYRADIPWWIFIAAGLIALIITLLTISYQTIKAALINPASTLKSE